VREPIRCTVCGTATLVRVQLGNVLMSYTLPVPCRGCETNMIVHVVQDAEQGTHDVTFDGAERLSSKEEVAFQIEASSEFVVRLTHAGEKISVTPYIRVCTLAGTEAVVMLFQRLGQFLLSCHNDWVHLRRVNELWLRGRTDLISQMMQAEFFINPKITQSKLDILMVLHHLNLRFLSPIADSSSLVNYGTEVLREISQLPPAGLKSIITTSDFHRYADKLFAQIDKYVAIFPRLVPAYNLTIIDPWKLDDEFFRDYGISSIAFEDVKSYYLDSFEVLGDLLDLVVALNNLKHRGSPEAMLQIPGSKIQTLSEFRQTTTRKMEYVKHGETFDKLLGPILGTPYRNAIGHMTWRYEPFTQVITMLESERAPTGKDITLLQFADLVRRMFGVVLQAWELIYHLQKLALIIQGETMSKELPVWLGDAHRPKPHRTDAPKRKRGRKKKKKK